MLKPDFIPDNDWVLVTKICLIYKGDPYFIAAIGWHETHWGRLGAGLIGWILGYGYFPGSTVKEKYKGLENQLNGACAQIGRDLVLPITLANVENFAVNSWKPGVPLAWAKSVFSIYTSLQSGFTPVITDAEINDISKMIENLSTIALCLKVFIIKLKKELDNVR